jgi:NADH-quinone oxidoreductase subunit F
MMVKTVSDLDRIARGGMARLESKVPQLVIGLGTCGVASGGKALKDFAEEYLASHKVKADVTSVGCIGMCHAEPLVDVKLPGKPRVTYSEMTVEKLKRVIVEHLVGGKPVKDCALAQLSADMSVSERGGLNYTDRYPGLPSYQELPFFAKQFRIVMRNCGVIDPQSIEEYVARGGYKAAFRALHEMSPEDVIEEVKKSGLRGRGGAGFPTGLKWEFCRKAPGDVKYLICNADEGDPGAYINRAVLEGDPHALVEGMIIAGYAMGSTEGFIYVRTEYPLAIERLNMAIDQAEKLGILGESVMGTSYGFKIKIREGAGVFVCGEETALIRSIEGKRGEPRQRPPFPATKGLWDRPTNINNVETLANIPVIIEKGGAWLSTIGTEKSKGTKGFSLVGKISRPGLVEVPMGILMKDIIYEIGGGVPDGGKFKAVQTGGPSGGCVPADKLDVPVDYENLKALGSIVGSGGMVVMDGDTCMVDVARYFLSFTSEESCGQCTPCRVGTRRMLEILTRITMGKGTMADLDLLKEMAETVRDASLCALGGTAPNPVLTTMMYFRHEYEDHVKNRRCRASVCAALFRAPCQNTCPAGTDIPGYIQLIKDGLYADAYELNMEDNPLPSICGRVCEHPCESRCQRAQFDEPISIRELKRFCSDAFAAEKGKRKSKLARLEGPGKRIAIVGGGPSGISAAYFLARLGYQPTIYEGAKKLGGMVRWGIPQYRLPHAVLDRDIEAVLTLGVKVKYGVSVGKDVKLKALLDEYDAVYLAVGAQKDKRLGLEGEDLKGVHPGLELLREINEGRKVELGKRVIIIGGGNVAVDVARSALRLGCKDVSICYRRTEGEMPAYAEEIADAKAEGVKLHFLVAPEKIVADGGRAIGMVFQRNKLGDYDSTGRRKPVPTEETLEIMADSIVTAIGQDMDAGFADGFADKIVTKRTLICADSETGATPVEKLFAGGDALSGPASVIEAIGDGKRAARSIDVMLSGRDRFPELRAAGVKYSNKVPDNERKMLRESPRHLPVKDRVGGFDEVVICMDEACSKREASRCFRCDLGAGEGGER